MDTFDSEENKRLLPDPVVDIDAVDETEEDVEQGVPGSFMPAQYNHQHTCMEHFKIGVFFVCYTLWVIILVTAGAVANSLALISESVHAMSDLVSYAIGGYLHIKSQSSADMKRPFGFGRLGVIGGLFSAVFLLCGALLVMVEALQKVLEPTGQVDNQYVILLGAGGLAVNIIGAFVVSQFDSLSHGHGHSHGGSSDPHSHSHSHSHENDAPSSNKRSLNLKAMLAHLLIDCLSSLIVLVSGILERHTPPGAAWHKYVDPGAGLLIALLIARVAFPIAKEATTLLLQTPPDNFPYMNMVRRLLTVKGIRRVDKLAVWRLGDQDSHIVCSCTLTANQLATSADTTSANDQHNELVQRVKHVLRSFGCTLLTVELTYQYDPQYKPIQLDVEYSTT